MAKVDRNTIQAALNEANQLEYELSTDESYRDLDEYEKWDVYNYGQDLVSLEDDDDYDDRYYDYDDRYDDDLMCFHHDYDNGDL